MELLGHGDEAFELTQIHGPTLAGLIGIAYQSIVNFPLVGAA